MYTGTISWLPITSSFSSLAADEWKNWTLIFPLIWAHDSMCRFFMTAEQLYGPRFLAINSHLHLHLSSCYKDYGPCYGFWLFSFERYNGLLGKYHTSQLSIEIQIIRQFINDMSVRNSSVNSIALNELYLDSSSGQTLVEPQMKHCTTNLGVTDKFVNIWRKLGPFIRI